MIGKQNIGVGFTKNEMIKISGDHQVKNMAKFMCCTMDMLF